MTTKRKLADHFKKATWDSHTEAETTGLINDILRGKASLTGYILFLQNLQPAYQMMESSESWLSTFPNMKTFFNNKVYRSKAIENDLNQLKKLCGVTLPPLLPQATAYAQHVQDSLINNHPAMLSHIYVRYLGDLNGGAVLKRLLGKHLSLPDDCLTFYDFPKIENIEAFRTAFRAALNAVEMDDAALKQAVFASIEAFNYNLAISNALHDTAPQP